MNVIHELRGKKTSLIVSHRLSTIENCDIVLKLVEGNYKEYNTSYVIYLCQF